MVAQFSDLRLPLNVLSEIKGLIPPIPEREVSKRLCIEELSQENWDPA